MRVSSLPKAVYWSGPAEPRDLLDRERTLYHYATRANEKTASVTFQIF